jgi:hypothetical protein
VRTSVKRVLFFLVVTMGRMVCVSVIGNVPDIERDWSWLQHWLPSALGEREIHWAIETSAKAIPDTNPDIALFIGTLPQASLHLFQHSFRIWVQTPQPILSSSTQTTPSPSPPYAAVDVKILLDGGGGGGTENGMEMVASAGYRLLIGGKAASQQQQQQQQQQKSGGNDNDGGGDLWPLVLRGPVDYAQSVDVTVWMREHPLLTKQALDQRLASFDKSMREKIPMIRTRYVQSMWNRHESACLASAIALRKLGFEDVARTYLWRLIGPLNIEPDAMAYIDEKGSPVTPHHAVVPVPTGARKRAVYELAESWLRDTNEPKHQKWGKSLVWKFHVWANDPKWISLMMLSHSPTIPYVAGANHEQNIAKMIMYGANDDNMPMMITQLRQFSEIARFQLLPAVPKWCTDLKSALAEAQSVANNGWSLVIDAKSTFGPMFMRDWDMILTLLPKIGAHWDLIQLGYTLPAFETTLAMCNTKPKTLLACPPTATAEPAFAFCVTVNGTKSKSNSPPRTLKLSTPTIFLPLF